MPLTEARKARARATVQAAVQTGACTITRDVEGRTDDLFDENTLTLSKPTGDDSAVYDGPCSLRPIEGLAQHDQPEGGTAVFLDAYRIRLLAEVTDVPLGAVVTITELDDPAMVGRQFTVTKVIGGTNAITRILLVQARARGPKL